MNFLTKSLVSLTSTLPLVAIAGTSNPAPSAGPNLGNAVSRFGDENLPSGYELAQASPPPLAAPTQGVPRRKQQVPQTASGTAPTANSPISVGKSDKSQKAADPEQIADKAGLSLVTNPQYRAAMSKTLKGYAGDARIAGLVTRAAQAVANDSSLDTEEKKEEAFSTKLNESLKDLKLGSIDDKKAVSDLYKVGNKALATHTPKEAAAKTKTTTENSEAKPSPDSPVTDSTENEIPAIDDAEQKLTNKFSAGLDKFGFKTELKDKTKQKIIKALVTAYHEYSELKGDKVKGSYGEVLKMTLKEQGLVKIPKGFVDKAWDLNENVIKEIEAENAENEIPELMEED